MAKIAVMFLLVALFAICHGHRIARDVPQAPANMPDALKAISEQIKGFINVENWDKAAEAVKSFNSEAEKVGNQVAGEFANFGKGLEKVIKENLPKSN